MENQQLFEITLLMAHYIHAVMKYPCLMENTARRDQHHQSVRINEYHTYPRYDVRYPLPGGAFLLILYTMDSRPSMLSALIGPSRNVSVYYCIGDISSNYNIGEVATTSFFNDYTPIDILGEVNINTCYNAEHYWIGYVPSSNYINYYLHGLVGDIDTNTVWGSAFDWHEYPNFNGAVPINMKRICDHFRWLSKYISKSRPMYDVLQMHLPNHSARVDGHLQNAKAGGRSWEVVINDFRQLLNFDNGSACLSHDGIGVMAQQMKVNHWNMPLQAIL